MNGTQENQTSGDAQNANQSIGIGIKKTSQLSQSQIKKLLDYDEISGVFSWKVYRGNRKPGDIAGSKNGGGYLHIQIDKKKYLLHRLVFLWFYGYWPENRIDHVDRNTLNNARRNLREASQMCNMRNQKVRKSSSTGITGVSLLKLTGEFVAHIGINHKLVFLGRYKRKEDAAMARWEAEKKHKFPNCCTRSSSYLYLHKNGAI